ncbi:MAG: hypothetical protein QNJ89_15330, partial [Acidimicrobiia bacterium]|nr:hypothetical protein [Acidimicrobiia bacterium]
MADDEAFECDDRGLEGQLKAEGFAGSRETTAERQAAATETRAFLVAWMAFSAIAFGVATATAVVSWRARAVLKQMAEDEPQRPPVDRWREWRSRTFALWWPVILLALAGGGLIVSLRLRFSAYDKMHESMLVPLWLVLFVVSVPTIVTLSRSQLVLRALGRTDHRSLTHLRTVGALQRTLIVMIGAGLVIGFLALSARWQLVDTLPGGRALPGTLVFLFGGIFAT